MFYMSVNLARWMAPINKTKFEEALSAKYISLFLVV